MRLGDLLDDPDLRLDLVHDPGSARDVEVDRVFTTDQPDPGRYLFGGELVLSGLIFHSGAPAESDVFVDALVRNGVVAFGVGEERFGCVPDHIVDACRRGGIPVFGVPEDVAFSRVTDHIVARYASDRTQALTASLARQRRLLDAVSSGRALDEMAAELVATTGIRCWVITTTGRPVVAARGGGRTLDDETIDELTEKSLQTGAFPIAVGELTILKVGLPPARRAGSWLLVVGGHLTDLPRDVLSAFEEFAAICALVRGREHDAWRAAARTGDRLAECLVAEAAPPQMQEALEEAGFASAGGFNVLSAELTDPADQHPTVRAALRDALLEVGHAAIGHPRGADVIAVVDAGGGGQALEAALRAHLGRLSPILRGALHVGVSDATERNHLAGALALARRARTLSEQTSIADSDRGHGRVWVVGSGPLASGPSILSMLPDPVRRTFAELVLGPLSDGDDRAGTDLLDTLAAFLAENGSWNRTAARLHVHVNTVRYRMSRIEALTGRDLSTTADRSDLHLALAVRAGG
ncbi:PucR family transcriptional regulator [Gordonia sp. HNM0687]|uniref:PucR family transcriptional regulator n=1 Tax=Gordonia mangrovi TaxID=2665643 RepID=A0A6L7GUE3_9ACTN|nr:PucR family transcriptional regulator [Gordonia mangrovi]MXP23122.1 PucR family transcriptional regulator [Gordonia mangrovi]UVF77406.1 PucR family transcriptional regulator [Gordonia mangrovi]